MVSCSPGGTQPQTGRQKPSVTWSQPSSWRRHTLLTGSERAVGQVRSGGSASVGPRDSMEDRHLIVSPVDEHLPETHLFGVFDGHRGSEAAAFLEAHLADALWQHRGRSAPAALKASSTAHLWGFKLRDSLNT